MYCINKGAFVLAIPARSQYLAYPLFDMLHTGWADACLSVLLWNVPSQIEEEHHAIGYTAQ